MQAEVFPCRQAEKADEEEAGGGMRCVIMLAEWRTHTHGDT